MRPLYDSILDILGWWDNTASIEGWYSDDFGQDAGNGYAHWKLLTQDHTLVNGGADLTDGDWLYSVTDNDLRTVGNGGYVENANGYDIRFETTTGTKLSHRVIYYDGTTGALIVLIKVPTLTYATDTEVKMWFGNSSVTTPEESTGAFNSNYKGVWPMSESPADGPTLDATSSGRDSDGDFSFNHTVGSGENRVIYILTSAQDSNHANLPVDSVTVGGVAATKIRHDEAAGNNRTEIWRLVAPAVGTQSIAVSATGSIGEFAAFAISFFDADQSDPDEADNGATGNSSGPSVSITPLTDQAWILSVCSAEASFSSNGTDQTTIATLTDQSFENARATYEGPKSPAGSADTQSFGLSSGQSWAMSSVVVKPAAQIKDLTANQYNMLADGGMTSGDLITGPIHKAIEFDGSDDYLVNTAWQSVIDENDARTISAWFAISSLVNSNWVSWGEAGSNNLSSLGDYGGDIGFLGYANDHAYSGAAYDDGLFHKISITHDGSTIKVIIDGVERVSASTTLGTNTLQDLFFGRWKDGGYANVKLAMIRISDVGRSNGYEITQYNAEVDNASFWSTGALDGGGGTAYTTTLTEPVVIVDVLVRQTSRTLTEVVTVVDTVIRTLSKTVVEVVTIVDTVVRSTSKVFTEVATIVDSVIRQVSRQFTEVVTLADTVVHQVTRVFTEVITIVDTITTAIVYLKELVEAVAVVDTITKQTTKVLGETVTIVDTVIRQISRVYVETVTVVDTVLKSLSKTLGEAVTVVDTITKQTTKMLTETVTVVDSIVRQITRVYTETVVVVDNLLKTTARSFTEAVAVVDSVLKTTAKVLGETITAVDTLLAGISFTRVLSETVTVVDSFIKSFGTVFTETVTLVDTITTQLFSKMRKGITVILSKVKDSMAEIRNVAGVIGTKRPEGTILKSRNEAAKLGTRDNEKSVLK